MMGTRPAADVVCGASELPQDSHHQAYMQALQGPTAGSWCRQIALRAANVETDMHPLPKVRMIPSGEALIHPTAWLH